MDSLIEIKSLCFDDEYRFDAEDFKSLINRPLFYVATFNDTVIGYIYLRIMDNNTGHYVRVAVHPNHRNRGVGTRLTAFAIRKFR